MRGFCTVSGLTLALCLSGCGERKALDSTGGNSNAVVAGNATAPANASASAETPVGPCPFATRGWEATIMPATEPGARPTVSLNGEVRPDSGGRQPMIFNLGERQPPVLVLELTSDPTIDPQADRGWMMNGGVFEDYSPDFTHVAVRCANTEIARVPIRPAP